MMCVNTSVYVNPGPHDLDEANAQLISFGGILLSRRDIYQQSKVRRKFNRTKDQTLLLGHGTVQAVVMPSRLDGRKARRGSN